MQAQCREGSGRRPLWARRSCCFRSPPLRQRPRIARFGICFDVTAGGQYFTNEATQFKGTCKPGGTFSGTFHTIGNTPIQPDLSFDYENQSGDYIKGELDTIGNAQGVLHIQSSFTISGTQYSCVLDTEWSARLSA